MENLRNLKIEDARILFRNFAGNETRYNREGNRNFCIVIDDIDTAENLKADGWNIKPLAPRDEDEEIKYYIQATVSFKVMPPKVWMVCGGRKVLLTEDTISLLDSADIMNVDVILRPYFWDIGNGKTGIKAYVKTMYVTIEEDEFASKYADEEFPEEMPF